jgi:hypothetical protein
MVPNEGLFSVRCWANFDVWLLVRNACLCSLNLTVKCLSVWPTYALLRTGHVSLYIPDSMYLLVVCCLCISLLPIVLLVRNAIFMLVRLKMFVTNAVCLPMYVNVAHFCFCVGWVLFVFPVSGWTVSVGGLGTNCFPGYSGWFVFLPCSLLWVGSMCLVHCIRILLQRTYVGWDG